MTLIQTSLFATACLFAIICSSVKAEPPAGASLPTKDKRALLGRAYAWAKDVAEPGLQVTSFALIGAELGKIGEGELAVKLLDAAVTKAGQSKPGGAVYEQSYLRGARLIFSRAAGAAGAPGAVESILSSDALAQAEFAAGAESAGRDALAKEHASLAVGVLRDGKTKQGSGLAGDVAVSLLRGGRKSEAADAVALETSSTAEARVSVARILIDCGRADEARAILSEVHAKHLPDVLRAYNVTADVLGQLARIGTKEQCERALADAVARAKKLGEDDRSDTIWRLAEAALAIPSLRKAREIELSLDSDEALLNTRAKLAIEYAHVGAIEDALRALAREDEDDYRMTAIMAVLAAATRADDAPTIAKQRPVANKLAPASAEGEALSLAKIAEACGDWKEAISQASKSKRAPEYIRTAAIWLAETEQWDGAAEFVDAFSRARGDPLLGSPRDLAAHVAYRAIAKRDLSAAMRIVAKIPEGSPHRGQVLLAIYQARGASLSPSKLKTALEQVKGSAERIGLVIGHLAGPPLRTPQFEAFVPVWDWHRRAPIPRSALD